MMPLELLELLFEFSSLGIVASVYSRLSSVTLNLQWNGRLIFHKDFWNKGIAPIVPDQREQTAIVSSAVKYHTSYLDPVQSSHSQNEVWSCQSPLHKLLTRVNLKF